MNRLYYLKKWFALFPGIWTPVAAIALMPHYHERARRRGSARRLLDAMIGIAFYIWADPRGRAVARRYGKTAAWRRGAVSLARARFADPNDVALFRIERAEEFDGYVRRFEDAGLNKQINPAAWAPGCVLADKVSFAARCRDAALPHPNVYAVLSGDGVEMLSPLQGQALLAKPATGEGGDGVVMLGQMKADDFADALRRRLGPVRAPMMIQDVAHVHPDLKGIALNALPTVRLCTFLNEEGRAEAVHAVFRFAVSAEAEVDNMKAGGLLAAIDMVTGALGIARHGSGDEDFEDHPLTGARIAGAVLPDWAETVSLALRAHDRAFSEYRLIGWDIAPTDAGPVLIEGNAKPSIKLLQRAGPSGLAVGRYGELLTYHLSATTPT